MLQLFLHKGISSKQLSIPINQKEVFGADICYINCRSYIDASLPDR